MSAVTARTLVDQYYRLRAWPSRDADMQNTLDALTGRIIAAIKAEIHAECSESPAGATAGLSDNPSPTKETHMSKKTLPASQVRAGDRIGRIGDRDLLADGRGPWIVDHARPGKGGSAHLDGHLRDGHGCGVVTDRDTCCEVSR